MLYVGWMDGMVIIGHRSSKSTFGAHKMHFVMYTETQSNMSSGTEKLKLASNIFSVCYLKFDFYFFSLIPEMQLEKIRVEQVEIVNRKIE